MLTHDLNKAIWLYWDWSYMYVTFLSLKTNRLKFSHRNIFNKIKTLTLHRMVISHSWLYQHIVCIIRENKDHNRSFILFKVISKTVEIRSSQDTLPQINGNTSEVFGRTTWYLTLPCTQTRCVFIIISLSFVFSKSIERIVLPNRKRPM